MADIYKSKYTGQKIDERLDMAEQALETANAALPKSGGTMDADATLRFVDANDTELVSVLHTGVIVGKKTTARATYLKDSIQVGLPGPSLARLYFPTVGGTLATTRDIPAITQSLTPQSTDGEVPSAKTVYDAIQAGGGASNVFVAVYEVTTLAEVAAAIAAGKVVLCNYEGEMLPLVEYNADPNDSIISVTFQHPFVDPADSDATISVETRVLNTQGWEDLGFSIATNEVEIFDYGAPYEDMRAAVDDGKVVIYRQAGQYFPLVSSSGNHLLFERVNTSGPAIYISGYDISQSGGSRTYRRLALFSDINVYIANRDEATFDDIFTAREDGKAVLLFVYEGIDDGGFFTLTNITDTTFTFAAVRNINGVPRAVFYTIENNDEWSTVSMDLAKVSDIPTVPTDVVKYSSQSLTDAQKAQARTNIDAGTSSFSGSYADLTNKPTIPTVPAISTDIAADKTSNTKTASPKAVYDEVHPAPGTSEPSGGFLPNVVYNLGTITGSVTFSMAAAVSGIVNHYYWTFDTGSTAPTITWPSAITGWNGGSAPTINASKHYEISVLNGIGAYMEV